MPTTLSGTALMRMNCAPTLDWRGSVMRKGGMLWQPWQFAWNTACPSVQRARLMGPNRASGQAGGWSWLSQASIWVSWS